MVEYTLEEALKFFSPEELNEIFDKVELLSDNKVIPAKERFKINDKQLKTKKTDTLKELSKV